MDRLTERGQETARLAGPVSDDDALDWRWVGEPEPWMGLRSERAMLYRPNSAVSGGEPAPDRFAACLARRCCRYFEADDQAERRANCVGHDGAGSDRQREVKLI